MDDSALINECVKGNAKAQKMLFDKFAPKMMTVCLRYASDSMEAEDILQDGFVKTFNKLVDFKQEGSLEGWIRRIMVNTALDAIRKNKKYAQDANIDDVGFKISNFESASDDIQAEDLLKLINSMPEGYKVVFNLFAIEGYSHKEISELMNISENTSKSQYSRARSYLRTRLEKLEIER
ncbi:MAG: sigma-70 family RNA polymerase sigma factor [Crocinitomicaceae bacterium]|nr:sigma-70 family RNA polymerase sigma factor [Crocinitomicaceae bacterium]